MCVADGERNVLFAAFVNLISPPRFISNFPSVVFLLYDSEALCVHVITMMAQISRPGDGFSEHTL